MIWRSPVSWSKFKLALDCPAKLGHELEKKPAFVTRPTYWADLGIIVQYVFEMYFNQGINLKPGGDKESVIEKITERVLQSPKFKDLTTTFQYGKGEDDLKNEIRVLVKNGFALLKEMKILEVPVRSEVKWSSAFRNMRMFGMMDFVIENPCNIRIYDGKGNGKKDADERQLLYYGLMAVSSGRKLVHSGFLYWKHDFEEVDVSPARLKEFVDGDFERGRLIFHELQTGVDSLPTTPSDSSCKWCNWNKTCPDSALKQEPGIIKIDTGSLTFGERL